MSKSAAPPQAARLAQLLDRQDILDCLIRFSRGMDRFDRDTFLSAFHPDATIAAGEFVGGPVALYDWACQLHDRGQSGTHHNLLNHSCDIGGDVAHTETYYLFVGRNNAIEWCGLVPTLPIPFADVPDIHLNGAASRSKDDPSYQRPLTNRRKAHIPPG
jgi:hypothetical protein